jgi:hypothetical protein
MNRYREQAHSYKGPCGFQGLKQVALSFSST